MQVDKRERANINRRLPFKQEVFCGLCLMR
nr:MAG TPA: hypothetical protein [Caudoviricetes sp.]